MKQETYDSWTDILGQTYQSGDLVGIAVVNNKSPQLVIGRVVSINKFNSKGEAIGKTSYIYEGHGTPPQGANLVESTPSKWYNRETGTYEDCLQNSYFLPTCTVTVEPLKDARGFRRGSYGKFNHETNKFELADPSASKRNVTYSIPENIIKVNVPQTEV